MDVQAIRGEIVGIDTAIYLNTGGLGLMPRASRMELQDRWAGFGVDLDPTAWYLDNLERARGLRERIAGFVGADADEIALKTSVADGYGSVLWGFDWLEGDEIVVTSEEHPTPRLAVELAARQFGLAVRVVPLKSTADDFLAELRQALSPRTRLVALSHVTTDSGTVLPAERICSLAREAGALTLFDGAHAVGQMPLDLHALGCDFYATMGYKWALGPMGSGFFYVRRDRQSLLHPIIGASGVSWQDVAAGRPEQAGGATRFEFASRAWPECFALVKSLEFVASMGILQLQAHVQELVTYLRSCLSRIDGVRIYTPAPPELSTGILTFTMGGIAPRDLSKALRERWQIVQRAAMMAGPDGGVRISLALYTTRDEVDCLVAAIEQVAREREVK